MAEARASQQTIRRMIENPPRESRAMTRGDSISLPGGGTARPLTPSGVEIEGVDLRKPVSEPAAEALRGLMTDYRIVVFRDQEITPEDQIRAMVIFGDNILDEGGKGA